MTYKVICHVCSWQIKTDTKNGARYEASRHTHIDTEITRIA